MIALCVTFCYIVVVHEDNYDDCDAETRCRSGLGSLYIIGGESVTHHNRTMCLVADTSDNGKTEENGWKYQLTTVSIRVVWYDREE